MSQIEKWEYKITGTVSADELNALGAQGWELAGIFPDVTGHLNSWRNTTRRVNDGFGNGFGSTHTPVTLIFKRPKAPQPPSTTTTGEQRRTPSATQALRLPGLSPAGQAPMPTTPQPSERARDLVLRGKALAAQRQYAEAIPLLERATRLTPDNFSAWFNLGYVHLTLQHWHEGLRAYACALSIKPNDVAAWTNTGTALSRLQRHAEALAAYEHGLAVDPAYVSCWTGKAVELAHLNRYKEALAAYARALALDPQNAFA